MTESQGQFSEISEVQRRVIGLRLIRNWLSNEKYRKVDNGSVFLHETDVRAMIADLDYAIQHIERTSTMVTILRPTDTNTLNEVYE